MSENSHGRVADATGLLPFGSNPSVSSLSAGDPSRGPLLAKAREQFAYWQERVRRQKNFEDCWDEDGSEYTPLGDDDAHELGYCKGRWAEAEWWLKTIEALPAPSHEYLVAEMTRRIEASAAQLSTVFPPKDDPPVKKAAQEVRAHFAARGMLHGFSQGIEARSAETLGSAEGESPVAEGHAPDLKAKSQESEESAA